MNEFEELAKLESGTVMKTGFESGIPFIIMRGPASLTAYLGIPPGHPIIKSNYKMSDFKNIGLSLKDVDITYDNINLDVHGGLTFGGNPEWLPPSNYWLGWDYAHSGDYAFYDLDFSSHSRYDHRWTVDEVYAEVKTAAKQLAELLAQEAK